MFLLALNEPFISTEEAGCLPQHVTTVAQEGQTNTGSRKKLVLRMCQDFVIVNAQTRFNL